jgi:AraC-like DNA-binding protein
MKSFLAISDECLEEPDSPCLKLFYVLEGNALAKVYENPISLQAGDILLVSSRKNAHTLEKADDSKLLFILLDERKTDEFLGPLLFTQNALTRFLFQGIYCDDFRDYCHVRTENDELVRRLFLELWEEFKRQEEFFDFALQHRFILLMTELVRRHKSHVVQDIPATLTAEGYELYNFITKSDFRLTLDDVARQFFIAPSYASRYVKKLTGMSFSTLMKSCRFYVATLMLSTTNKSVSAISEQVGYDNPENFIRAFKREYHVTPTQYRLQSQ